MEAKLTPIGSSKGVRIPKLLIEKYKLLEGIELTEMADGILIHKAKKPREGWAQSFKQCAEEETGTPDFLLPANQWDEGEWEW